MDSTDAPAADAARQEAKVEAHRIVMDAQKAGVPAFEFPADASPEDKAAMAKKVRAGTPPPSHGFSAERL
jgi:hypothetical protein